MSNRRFVLVNDDLVPVDSIIRVNVESLPLDGTIEVWIKDKGWKVSNEKMMVDILREVHPTYLEGHPKFKWVRRSWTIHNLLGHPVMEVLSRLGFPHLGLRVHDRTIPRSDRMKKP